MMKRKILLLIIGCVVTVVALICIQGYFIGNTYKLNVKEANAAITQQFMALETSGKMDTLNKAWMNKTGNFIKDYVAHKANKEVYEREMKKTSDSLSQIVIKLLEKERFFENYDVSYASYLTAIIILDKETKATDTLFSGKMLIFGNNTEHNNELKASQTKSRDDDSKYSYVVVSDRFYGIANWEKRTFIRMSGLLIFSAALLIFVVLLFYWSIKSLITQKKINDIKTDFINNITHEFQTPLAALDIAVTTLKKKEQELTPQQFSHALSIIERQNVRMQKLFSEVTKASLATDSIDTSNTKEITSADIQEIVNDFKLSHPGVEILFNENKGVTFYMDRFHLDTILVNLLDNAEKYGAGVITLKLEKSAKGITLAIQDNGIGIAKKEQLAIFDKFYRVQKGDIHTTKGLGLGLFYVSRIIEAYMGTITVNSEEGKGAAFIISIP